MNFKLLAVCVLLLSTAGCSEPAKTLDPIVTPNTDYLLFGHFYGECGGEACIEIYKLTGRQLFEDSLDRYPGGDSSYPGKFRLLDDSLFQLVKGLSGAIPIELLQSKAVVFGMPDATDGGGIYLERSENGKVKVWLIDKDRRNNPAYLYPFVDSIESAIDRLSEW